MTQIEVKVTVDLPGPNLRGIRHGTELYVSHADLLESLDATAKAYDDAHANADCGRVIRAYKDAIDEPTVKDFV